MGLFIHTDNDNSHWSVEFQSDGVYRDYVILAQVEIPAKRKVPFIMLNPGSFSDEKSFARDNTLRNLRKAFLNTGYQIEVLNLFNKNEPNEAHLQNSPDKEKNNPLYERLQSFPSGTKVIIQWGKPHPYSEFQMKKCLHFLSRKGFVVLGIKNNDGISFRHPSRWNTNPENFVLFQQQVISRL